MRLDCSEVSAGYGPSNVLDGISLAVEAGALVGLIGPNGAGKSTLLRVLSRVLRPHAGIVRLDGRDISHLPAREIARAIAFVPQQETCEFDFSVRDIVMMGRYAYRSRSASELEKDHVAVNSALSTCDIAGLADRSARHLSGGEYRRALLARALAQDAPLLLLDEPTAHLDIAHQADMLHLVHRLITEGRVGALAAMHDLNQAAEYCDRLILLRAGRVVMEGTPAEVVTPEAIACGYGATVEVGVNPTTGRPIVYAVHSSRVADNR